MKRNGRTLQCTTVRHKYATVTNYTEYRACILYGVQHGPSTREHLQHLYFSVSLFVHQLT